MKKYCCGLLAVVWSWLLVSCGDDDYYYPSVKQDFLTAFYGADGQLEAVQTDDGEKLRVVEDMSGSRADADASVRIIANYETVLSDNEVAGVKLYALSQTISPVPLPADKFEEGIKTEPRRCRASGGGRIT